MKLLLDQNLSPWLVRALADLFPELERYDLSSLLTMARARAR